MRSINIIVPAKEDYFVLVLIWEERKDYIAATTDTENVACFIEYALEDKNGNPITAFPLLGTVHFAKGAVDAGVVAHEFTHVAFKLTTMTDRHEEEFFAETVQELNRNFWEAVQDNSILYDWIYEGEYGEEE